MTTNKHSIFLIVGALLMAGTSLTSYADDNDTPDINSVAVSIEQAIEIAKQASDGNVISIELENDEGVLLWEIEMTSIDQQEVEIGVDANSGEILMLEEDD